MGSENQTKHKLGLYFTRLIIARFLKSANVKDCKAPFQNIFELLFASNVLDEAWWYDPLMPEISRVIDGLITGVKVFEAAKNENAGLKQRILDIDIFNVDSKKTI